MRLAEQIRTTTFLLTLRYMVLFFLSVTILMAVINWAIVGYVERRADESVVTALNTFAALYRDRGLDGIAPLMAARQSAQQPGESIFLLADAAYRPVLGNIPGWPQLEPVDDGWVRFLVTGPEAGTARYARGRVAALPGGLWLLAGRPLLPLAGLEDLLDRAFVLVLGITLALALAGGLLMSNNVLRQVNAINATARQIMAGDLSRRMPTKGTRDEFDELSRNLNAMLDQIESLMGSVRHVSDNVAHDLRTPLTRLRNRLEALQGRLSAEDARELEACVEDADQLLSTFTSLLSIARIESGASESDYEVLDLAPLVADACDLYQALAEDKDIELRCDTAPQAEVRGDRNLIFQAVTNLLDNAIKYTPASGTVAVRLRRDNDIAEVTVADSGPGVPQNLRSRVLERFYRLDDSRTEPGSGLGLSLVQAIARRHRGRVELADNRPGLRVSLILPRWHEPGSTAAEAEDRVA